MKLSKKILLMSLLLFGVANFASAMEQFGFLRQEEPLEESQQDRLPRTPRRVLTKQDEFGSPGNHVGRVEQKRSPKGKQRSQKQISPKSKVSGGAAAYLTATKLVSSPCKSGRRAPEVTLAESSLDTMNSLLTSPFRRRSKQEVKEEAVAAGQDIFCNGLEQEALMRKAVKAVKEEEYLACEETMFLPTSKKGARHMLRSLQSLPEPREMGDPVHEFREFSEVRFEANAGRGAYTDWRHGYSFAVVNNRTNEVFDKFNQAMVVGAVYGSRNECYMRYTANFDAKVPKEGFLSPLTIVTGIYKLTWDLQGVWWARYVGLEFPTESADRDSDRLWTPTPPEKSHGMRTRGMCKREQASENDLLHKDLLHDDLCD